MGGRTEVDLTQLRTVADHVMTAAETIAEMRWPKLDPVDLQGSAVGRIAAPDLVAARLTDVVANMRGWAMAAHMSAAATTSGQAPRPTRRRRPREALPPPATTSHGALSSHRSLHAMAPIRSPPLSRRRGRRSPRPATADSTSPMRRWGRFAAAPRRRLA